MIYSLITDQLLARIYLNSDKKKDENTSEYFGYFLFFPSKHENIPTKTLTVIEDFTFFFHEFLV